MKKIFFLCFAGIAGACVAQNSQENSPVKYIQTKKVDTVDTYFGTKVADPYRWLENDKSEEAAEWVKAENKMTFDYLSKIPFRNKIKERLTQIWNFTKVSAPFKKGKYYFFYKNDGIQNQSILYVQEGLNSSPRVLLDPNKLSVEGTTSLSTLSVSKDAKYLAFSLSKAGSDWSEIQIINIETGTTLQDVVKWVKFSNIAWKGNGFYYSRYDAPVEGRELSKKNEFHKIYYHRLGDIQDKDILIFEDKNSPLRNFSAELSEDEKLLVVFGSQSTSGVSMAIKDLTDNNSALKVIVENFENDYSVIDKVGNSLLVETNKNAPKHQLVLIDTKNPAPSNWKIILPEKQDLLESVALCGNKIIAKYLKDVTSRLYVYSMDGKQEREIILPGIGKVDNLESEKNDTLAFFSFSTFTAPATIFKYNLRTNNYEVFYKPKIDFKSEDYETKQVFFASKDGTKIPMFITCKKGIKLDGSNPTFLFGYGGFNSYYYPEFKIDRAIFLENGGIYAIPGLRGGGDYGEEWHKAGTQLNKQNVFDDFIAAAEYLIKEKYTNSSKLAIHGRSNGGLLIGAVMTQRPELAKVAIPAVGVLDMLRYHKFTIGWAWAGDYGTSDDEKNFRNLIKYSPLHNIKELEYPATLVTTADHDDRVVPAHSFKFISTLQEKQKGTTPVLIRIDVNAGHGSGKPVSKQIEEFTDIWSFVFYNLGMKY